jgi:amino acid transporter
MSIRDLLFGRALASSEEGEQRVGVVAGIPMLGLDALSSAAYGPEAALTLLIPLGAAGIAYVGPISFLIIVLLFIVYISYRQTIGAYPNGGGSYTVAHENLGTFPGLLAAAALMLDYVLTVAVGISAGVGALVSAAPALQPHTLTLCLVILGLLVVVNLRGVRESGIAFMLPTYLFIVSLLGVIALGLIKTAMNGGRPTPVVAPPELPKAVVPVSIWLLLHAFASGCTAMTGVEAVSNGIRAFREPAVQNARRTLTVIIVTLAVLLAGIALLCHAYHIGATEPGQEGYQSVLSQVTAAVVGRGFAYYVTIGSVICVLALSANTGFADFPRLCRAIAADSYLPHGFAHRGRRLVYSQGIVVLAALAGALLILFGGITDHLIPLFAVGAFLAFTMSQAGMVVHWKKTGGKGSRLSMVINGVGAICTGLTLVIVLIAKFRDGAWITVLIIPALIATFYWVHHHYERVMRELACDEPVELGELEPPLVVLLVRGWSAITRKATQLALTISPEVYALHIAADEENAQDLQSRWAHLVKEPAGNAGFPAPRLVVVSSPFRRLYRPLLDFLKELERAHPERQIAVVIPELVERRWYHYLLHNQTATVLKYYLYTGELERVSIVNVPWYLKG